MNEKTQIDRKINKYDNSTNTDENKAKRAE